MDVFRLWIRFGIFYSLTTLSISSCGEHDVVFDSNTGLMWQDDEDAGNLQKFWLTKEMYESERYFDTSGDTANSYCEELVLAGYKDWRLPTEEELGSTIEVNRCASDSMSPFKNVASDFYWTATTPTGDDAISISINGQHLNTSSVVTLNGEPVSADNNPFAFVARVVFFSNGKHGAADKYSLGSVRCVRKNTQRL